jgi:hypothetical protein
MKNGFQNGRGYLAPALFLIMLFNTGAAVSAGFIVEPAPAGNPKVVAGKIIRDNFTKNDCPAVISAGRLSDGTIKATCSNRESFRVLTLPALGKKPYLAMRCSAVIKLGISGC